MGNHCLVSRKREGQEENIGREDRRSRERLREKRERAVRWGGGKEGRRD